MEQRSVIVSAVIVAIILAGVLWYVLTRTPIAPEGENVALATATPTAQEPLQATPSLPNDQGVVAGLQNGASLATPLPTSVPPTAQSGAGEIMIGAFATLAVTGTWGLRRVLRRA